MKLLSILVLVTALVAGAMATSFSDAVVAILLIDSKTNKIVKILENGDAVQSADPGYNLQAIVDGDMTRSVRVAYGTLQNKVNIEDSAPWVYCSNKARSRSTVPGTHTVFFTPYSKPNAGGEKGTTLNVTFTVEKPKFDITLNLDVVEEAYQGAFEKAAAFWSSIIKKDLPDLDLGDFPSDECYLRFPRTTIDDVLFCCYLLDAGDEPWVGTSYVEYTRDSNLPVMAWVILNYRDKDDPVFEKLILQLMGQALGVGSSWEALGLTKYDNVTETCSYAEGKAAAEFKAISGCDAVPVVLSEPNWLNGMRCFYWADCLNDEIFTRSLTPDKKVSRIAIGALQDLGYTVDFSKADPFTTADLGAECVCSRRGLLRDGNSIEGPEDTSSAVISATGKQHGRRLSAKVQAQAVATGQAILAQNKAKHEAAGGDAAVPAGVKYAGDKFVMVAVRDGDAIVTVPVMAAA